MTIGNLATKEGLVTFAGINSSAAEQKAGKNEHLRSFLIQYPPRRQKGAELRPDGDTKEQEQGRISPIGKTSLFKASRTNDPEMYQRKLRLSPAQPRKSGSKRIGAVASSLGLQGQIVVFNATTPTPGVSDVIQRIDTPTDSEAADIDIAEPSEGDFLLAYCTDDEVLISRIEHDFSNAKSTNKSPSIRRVHAIPSPTGSEKVPRTKIRALRFLTERYLLLLCNLPNRSGSELLILQLYPTGPGSIMLRKRLPNRIKTAVGLDVCALDADPETGERQYVVAVAGQDVSIEVLVIDYRGHKSEMLSTFRTVSTFRNVHPFQMTGIVLEPFHASSMQALSQGQKDSKSQTPASKPGPQYLHLASTSMGNTVVVDTFTLQALQSSKGQSRYILSSARAQKIYTGATAVLASFILLVSAILLQSFLSQTTASQDGTHGIGSVLSSNNWLHRYLPSFGREVNPVQKAGDAASKIADAIVPDAVQEAGAQLRELLLRRISTDDHASKALIIRSSPETEELSTEVHPDVKEFIRDMTADRQATDSDPDKEVLNDKAELKKWEDLSLTARQYWTQKLEKAGAWAASEGETVLKGVFFSELAGAVGEAFGDAIRG